MTEQHPLQPFITKLETHCALDANDRQALLDLPYKLRSLNAGAYLVREGDRTERCAVLLSGYAFRHKLTGDGARQIIALQIAGDAVDLQHLFLDEADHNVQMLTRGEIAEVPRQPLEELVVARPGVGRAVLVATLVEASTFREWTLNIGHSDSRSRIAHLLCEFAVRLTAQDLEPDGSYELPMTQEQLADATGLTAVHTNRTLQALRRQGLIALASGHLTVLDWQRLVEVGDFSERYLHHGA